MDQARLSSVGSTDRTAGPSTFFIRWSLSTTPGTTSAQLSPWLAGENLLLTVLAIAPGLAIGYWFSALFMDSFSSDLFDFGLEMRTTIMVRSALAILVVSALAQLPAGRALA